MAVKRKEEKREGKKERQWERWSIQGLFYIINTFTKK